MKKIWITGKNGLMGSALTRVYSQLVNYEVLSTDSSEVNLLEMEEINNFIRREAPEVIIMAAALVGGIGANQKRPGDFILSNLLMQSNLFASAQKFEVSRLVFLASSCVYPQNAPIPTDVRSLFQGSLEPNTKPYAVAKLAGLETVAAMRQQYGLDWISVIPSNIYGPGDNFSPDSSHVMAALIRKFWEANKRDAAEVEVWGTGLATREFTHAEDAAHAISLIEQSYSSDAPINVSSGQEISIRELVDICAMASDFKGSIRFDSDRPEGALRKFQDGAALRGLGWKPKIDLRDGIIATYKWFDETLSSGGAVRL